MESLIHKSKTVRDKNIKILFSRSVIYNLKVCNQEVNKSFIQANGWEMVVYVMSDQRFGPPLHIILKLLKPLFGLTEPGDYWFEKYTLFLKTLGFQYISSDLSFYHHTTEGKLQESLALYVNDTLAGNDNFMKLTDKMPKQF